MLVKGMSLFINKWTYKTPEQLGKKHQKITINFQSWYAAQKNHRGNGAYLSSRFHKDKNTRLPASAQTTVLSLHGGNKWPLKPAENVPNHCCSDRKRPDGWHTTTHHLKLQQGENHQVLKQPFWIVLLQALSLEEKLYHLPQIKESSNWQCQLLTCPPHCYQVPYEQHENLTDFPHSRQIAVNAKHGRVRRWAAALRQQLLTLHMFSNWEPGYATAIDRGRQRCRSKEKEMQ